MGSASSKKRRRRAAGGEPNPDALGRPAPPRAEDPLDAPYIPHRGFTIVLLLVALAGVTYFVSQGLEQARTSNGVIAQTLLRVQTRDEAPKPFDLEALEGGSKVSLEGLEGKVVFLNFWATWCPPCVEEMPSMRRLSEKFADDDRFVMLAVSADDEWAPVRNFFRQEKPPFSVLLDPGGELANQYGTEKFPETYLVVDGRLVGYIVGPRDWDTWYAEAYLRSLLSSRPS